MDGQYALNALGALVAALFGWLFREIWSHIKDLQKADAALHDKVSAIEVLVAGKYVTRDEMQTAIGAVVASVDKMAREHSDQGRVIFQKLDLISEQLSRKEDRR